MELQTSVRHILSATDIPPENLLRIFTLANQYGKTFTKDLEGVMVMLAFEGHSTRARFFSNAVQFGGGRVVEINLSETSMKFGESLSDTIRVLSGQCHCIVLRYPSTEAMREAVLHSQVPVINAGDGTNEHPTQAVIDVFTIWQALQGDTKAPPRIPTNKKLNIVCWGDNLSSRAVRSFVKLIASHGSALGIELERIGFYGPLGFSNPPDDIVRMLEERQVPFDRYFTNAPRLEEVDIVYATRQYNETHEDQQVEPIPFTRDDADLLPEHALIMSPMPLSGVIEPDVMHNQRAWYFTQADNGLKIRRALLRHLANSGKLR